MFSQARIFVGKKHGSKKFEQPNLVGKYDRRLAHAIAKFHVLESFPETRSQEDRRTKVVAPAGGKLEVQASTLVFVGRLLTKTPKASPTSLVRARARATA